jgi:hypothetical protein
LNCKNQTRKLLNPIKCQDTSAKTNEIESVVEEFSNIVEKNMLSFYEGLDMYCPNDKIMGIYPILKRLTAEEARNNARPVKFRFDNEDLSDDLRSKVGFQELANRVQAKQRQ